MYGKRKRVSLKCSRRRMGKKLFKLAHYKGNRGERK